MQTPAVWLAFSSTRLLLIVIGYVVLTLFPANPVESWQGIVFPHNNWIDGWVRWDSMWYEAIVNPNPRFLPSGHSSANFFPLYSWVSWLVSLPLRALLDHERAFYVGGLIVSAAALAGRPQGGEPAGDEPGRRRGRGAHRLVDRRLPVLVFPDGRLRRRVVFLPRRVVPGACV